MQITRKPPSVVEEVRTALAMSHDATAACKKCIAIAWSRKLQGHVMVTRMHYAMEVQRGRHNEPPPWVG